jgi:cysteinyl-tRNA synthetase
MADMEKLNVELPEMLTRVSEFVPEIVEYIGKIIENGFAYEANGSVYFDTEAYKAGGFVYGKLEPSSVLDTEKLAEGEGALTADTVVSEKKG